MVVGSQVMSQLQTWSARSPRGGAPRDSASNSRSGGDRRLRRRFSRYMVESDARWIPASARSRRRCSGSRFVVAIDARPSSSSESLHCSSSTSSSPCRAPREPACSRRGKRRPVVRAHRLRQPGFLKRGVVDLLDPSRRSGRASPRRAAGRRVCKRVASAAAPVPPLGEQPATSYTQQHRDILYTSAGRGLRLRTIPLRSLRSSS